MPYFSCPACPATFYSASRAAAKVCPACGHELLDPPPESARPSTREESGEPPRDRGADDDRRQSG